MTQIISQCQLCTRFHRENREGDTCDAFPNGIPEDVLWNEKGHKKPIEGDHGLQFEEREDHPYKP